MAKGYLWHGWINLEEIDIDPSGFVFYGGYVENAEIPDIPSSASQSPKNQPLPNKRIKNDAKNNSR